MGRPWRSTTAFSGSLWINKTASGPICKWSANISCCRSRTVQAVTKAAGRWARALGARELCVWSAFDGYDYAGQIDYAVAWARVVDAFREAR
ncbi:MAG: hypothetical protein VXV97_12050, partial [Pseudomonadota bacterium]|nr:hypothetical protein [Pseudomonadota bacterium]